MAKVRVILKQRFKYPAGFRLKVYGHDFVMQKDGTAAAIIDEAFLKNQCAKDRYVLAEEAPKEIPTLDTSYVDSFGYDIGQYYGAGSLENLKEKIEDMRKSEISHFAQTRLGQKIGYNLSKDRMIFELVRIIQEQLRKEKRAESVKIEVKNDTGEKPDATEIKKTDGKKMAFTFVDPEEKAASSAKGAAPKVEKSREELIAELDELEKLAQSRKTTIAQEKES